MRYLPMILGAGLLLSVGYLRALANLTPPWPRSRWIVPLSRTRQLKRLATDTTEQIRSSFLSQWLSRTWMALATDAQRTDLAIAGPITVDGLGVAGV